MSEPLSKKVRNKIKRKKWVNKQLALGRCVYCNNPPKTKRYCEEHLEFRRMIERAYRQRHPKKILANQFANRIKNEVKSDSCDICDSTLKLEMHHPNYNKPEVIITLCERCHKEAHYGRR